MAIDAVIGDVGDPVLEPLDRNLAVKDVFLTLVKGLNQSMRVPCLAQNFSGLSELSLYHFRYLSLSIKVRALAVFNTG